MKSHRNFQRENYKCHQYAHVFAIDNFIEKYTCSQKLKSYMQ